MRIDQGKYEYKGELNSNIEGKISINPIKYKLDKGITEIDKDWYISTNFKKDDGTRIINSIITFQNNKLIIKEVYNLTNDKNFKMSSLILEQIRYAWKDYTKIDSIKLDNVVNSEIRDLLVDWKNSKVVNDWWKLWWLDKMSNYITMDLWKNIEKIEIKKIVEGIDEFKYDIILFLK